MWKCKMLYSANVTSTRADVILLLYTASNFSFLFPACKLLSLTYWYDFVHIPLVYISFQSYCTSLYSYFISSTCFFSSSFSAILSPSPLPSFSYIPSFFPLYSSYNFPTFFLPLFLPWFVSSLSFPLPPPPSSSWSVPSFPYHCMPLQVSSSSPPVTLSFLHFPCLKFLLSSFSFLSVLLPVTLPQTFPSFPFFSYLCLPPSYCLCLNLTFHFFFFFFLHILISHFISPLSLYFSLYPFLTP